MASCIRPWASTPPKIDPLATDYFNFALFKQLVGTAVLGTVSDTPTVRA